MENLKESRLYNLIQSENKKESITKCVNFLKNIWHDDMSDSKLYRS